LEPASNFRRQDGRLSAADVEDEEAAPLAPPAINISGGKK